MRACACALACVTVRLCISLLICAFTVYVHARIHTYSFEDSPIKEMAIFNWVLNSEQSGKKEEEQSKVVPFDAAVTPPTTVAVSSNEP